MRTSYSNVARCSAHTHTNRYGIQELVATAVAVVRRHFCAARSLGQIFDFGGSLKTSQICVVCKTTTTTTTAAVAPGDLELAQRRGVCDREHARATPANYRIDGVLAIITQFSVSLYGERFEMRGPCSARQVSMCLYV